MKLFGCLSRNVSIIQEQETKRKQQLDLKRRNPIITDGEVKIPCKNQCHSDQFAPVEGDRLYSTTEPLGEDNIDQPFNETNQFSPILQSTFCRVVDSSQTLTDEPDFVDFDSLLSLSDNPICINDDTSLDETYTVHPFCVLSSVNAYKGAAPFNIMSDANVVSFPNISDIDIEYSSVTPAEKRWPRKLIGSSRPFFHDRYPPIPQNDGSYLQQMSVPRNTQSKLSGDRFQKLDMKLLADCNLLETRHTVIGDSTFPEPTEIHDLENAENFNVGTAEEYSTVACDMNDVTNSSSSTEMSSCLDSVIMGPDELFQNVDDSQVLEITSPARDTLIRVTVFSDGHRFGFSLTGECPPTVSRVDKDSPAEKSGILKGDEVLKVNGQKTHISSCEAVAQFIKTDNPKYLILELYRRCQNTKNNSHRNPKDVVCEDNMFRSYLQETRFDPRSMTSTVIATIHRLTSLEEDYVDVMHSWMERFPRPPRGRIFSNHQHITIIQNIAKLVTISEYNIKQMKENRPSIKTDFHDYYLSALVYESKIDVLCQAYEAYGKGFERAHKMLREMRTQRTFTRFTKEVICYETLEAFINRPIQHMQDLHKVFSEVLALTPKHRPNFGNLQKIVDRLSQCVQTVVELCPVNTIKNAVSDLNRKK